MQKKKRIRRPSLPGRAHIPSDGAALIAGYRVEMVGAGERQRLLISGADRILSCTEEEVVFVLRSRRLSLKGGGLSCLTYEGGVAEVSGDVSFIALEKRGVEK
ncbi:MAG: YabP/YqfC family sporulation protein [Clostridia bacterium]|nr:YabP/YqfC family sporulation protein [Clostridia bacterium]